MDHFDHNMVNDNNYLTIDDFNADFTSEHDFFIFHQNIRSFDRNFDELSAFFTNLDPDIDVLILTETWFSDISVVDLDGYRGFHSFRSGVRGGGVSIYVREAFNCNYIPENYSQ